MIDLAVIVAGFVLALLGLALMLSAIAEGTAPGSTPWTAAVAWVAALGLVAAGLTLVGTP